MTIDEIRGKYEARILVLLNKMRACLIEAGHDCSEPWESHGDDYRWEMQVDADEGGESGIDVSFTICESEHWDGSQNGVNFMVDVVSFGGRMLGGLCPHNYTDECWVDRDDEEAIEERFGFFETAPADGILECVERAD